MTIQTNRHEMIWRLYTAGDTTYGQIAAQTGYSLNQVRYSLEAYRKKQPTNGNGHHPHPNRRRTLPARREMFRAGVFDIECTDFKSEGDEGLMLCLCMLPLDSDEVITLRLNYDDAGDDRRLLAEAVDLLDQYTILIGHNIRRFDLAWLRSRFIYHNMAAKANWYYVDTYTLAQALDIKTRKSLENLGDFFGLDGEKTRILTSTWSGARSRYPARFEDTMSKVVYHCQQDVRMNRELFWRLWPLEPNASQPQLKRGPSFDL